MSEKSVKKKEKKGELTPEQIEILNQEHHLYELKKIYENGDLLSLQTLREIKCL